MDIEKLILEQLEGTAPRNGGNHKFAELKNEIRNYRDTRSELMELLEDFDDNYFGDDPDMQEVFYDAAVEWIHHTRTINTNPIIETDEQLERFNENPRGGTSGKDALPHGLMSTVSFFKELTEEALYFIETLRDSRGKASAQESAQFNNDLRSGR